MKNVKAKRAPGREQDDEEKKGKRRGGFWEMGGGAWSGRRGVKILSDQEHIIGLVNIHSFLRYSEG